MQNDKLSILEEFTECYPVSKTLKFKLLPQGKTLEYIEKNGVLEKDMELTANYQVMKKLMDECHKDFIEKVLSDFRFDEELENFAATYINYVESKDASLREELDLSKKILRKQLGAAFKEQGSEHLFGIKMINEILPEYIRSTPDIVKRVEEIESEDHALDMVNQFSRFASYFLKYNTFRKRLYEDDDKAMSVAYRIVDENLPRYLNNLIQHNTYRLQSRDILSNLKGGLKNNIAENTIDCFFTIEGYNHVLTQQGITLYNTVLGGVSEGGNIQIPGMNEYISIYNNGKDIKIPKMQMLYKQLLCNSESLSFIPEKFSSDQELINNLYAVADSLFFEQQSTSIAQLEKILGTLNSLELDKVYIENGVELKVISSCLYGRWNAIFDALVYWYDNSYTGKKKKETDEYEQERKENLNKHDRFSIAFLNQVIKEYPYLENKILIEDYFSPSSAWYGQVRYSLHHTYEQIKPLLVSEYPSSMNLRKDSHSIALIKDFLDAVKGMFHYMRPLLSESIEEEKGEFYKELEEFESFNKEFDLFYNKVRTYLTKQEYAKDKIKLNFSNAFLLSGWDINKENINGGLFFRKDGKFYLGILPKGIKHLFDGILPEDTEYYEKMQYKLLPDPAKMLPKVFFSKKGIETYQPPEIIVSKYRAGTHKKGNDFSLSDMRALIDFYKSAIPKCESWSTFSFHFSDTESYENISQFYDEVLEQGYKMTFKNIPAKYVHKLVDEGLLYLFQVYNQDFSPNSKGMDNLHTMYFKAIFSERNMLRPVYKMNGNAEIFYRKASIRPEARVIHKANELIVNRGIDKKMSKTVSQFSYDIVKNKRFTEDQFEFHIPITVNYAKKAFINMNAKVNTFIKQHNDLYVIGINRGENHLVYITVLDKDGNLVKEISLNSINTYNGDKVYPVHYAKLLEARAKEMKQENKNWKKVNSIKELKEGYVSQVVSKIMEIFEEYPGIIVMEDFTVDFKQKRQKIEKNVYQQLEKQLITKMNLYVNKRKNEQEVGGLFRGLQLTNPFVSFKKMGKQNGFLFFVNPSYITNVDPVTGFANFFDTRYKNIQSAREFFSKFEDISFNRMEGCFDFKFDYSKFTGKVKNQHKKWTISTHGERIQVGKDEHGNWSTENVDLTEKMKELFLTYGIDYTDNLKILICSRTDKKFYTELLSLFELTLQMRNVSYYSGEEYFISPIKDEKGYFYTTRKFVENLPQQMDGIGSFNVARKGLWALEQIRKSEDVKKVKLVMTNDDWFNYIQK